MKFTVKSKAIKAQKNTEKNGLMSYVWMGANYTISTSFVLTFSFLFFGNGRSTNLGYNIFWIFAIDALIAAACSFAYLTLTKYHHKVNGGAYVYVRATAGRFWGFFMSAAQYLVLPVTIASSIVALVRANFLGDPSVGGAPSTPTHINVFSSWGYGASLYLDLIGITVFVLLAVIIIFGLKWLRRFLFPTLYIRWGGILFVAGVCLALIILNKGEGYKIIKNHTTFNFQAFTNVLITSFFFFIGFESFAAVNQQIKNPGRNVPLGMVIIMAVSAVFYIVFTGLLIGALENPKGFAINPFLQLFTNKSFSTAGADIGITLVLILILTTKINFTTQLTFYSTHGGVYPMAKENYIPGCLAKTNKHRVYGNAVVLNIVLCLIVGIFFLIIPDIIVWKDRLLPSQNPFNFTTLISLASVLLMISYVFVIFLALWLKFHHHKKISNVLVGFWCFGLFALLFMITSFLGFTISTIINSHKSGDVTKIVLNWIQLIYFLGVFVVTPIWYYAYYYPIYKKRMRENPELQAQLDSKFRILPFDSVLDRVADIADIPLATKNRLELARAKLKEYDLIQDGND